MSCVFCEIVKGNTPAFKVWEDDKHLAFLTIFPNTEGTTVVVPKEHYASYAFDLPDEVLAELILASKKVAKILDTKLEDVGRTALVFEGFGVDHTHAKLYPMHGTANMEEWKPIESMGAQYYEKYPGFITTQDCDKVSQEDLSKTYQKLIS